jgi:transcriptional regulator with XRE-family HTH domain
LAVNYGELLKNLRKDSNFSQKDLAEKLNVRQGTVSAWEKSAYPPLDAIEKVCNYFNKPMWEFFLDDPVKLKNYIPPYITPDDAEILKILNTRIEPAIRVSIKRSFVEIMKTALLSAGIPLEGALGK